MFARKGLAVAVAGRRPPEAFASEAKAIGPTVTAVPLDEALQADMILLAIPFGQHQELARGASQWDGKILVDVTNAFGVPVEELGGRPSSAVLADAFQGARLVKAFNHLAAAKIAADPNVNGGRRVIFVSSDDDGAAEPVKVLAEQLGFAPVWLGKLAEGGALVQARDKTWAPLIFQDFVKFDHG